MERENQTALRNCKESASHIVNCFHKRAQVKSNFTYFMRTIELFEDYVDPMQEAIDDLLLPTLFSQSEPLPNKVCHLVTLAMAQAGLGMPDLRAEVPQQYEKRMKAQVQ